MKARHIIMIIILILAISIFISNNGIEEMTCTTKGELYESPSVSTLEISIKDNKIKDMGITIDVSLTEELMRQRETLMQMIASQGKSNVEKTENGIRLTSGMDGSYFSSLGLSKDTTYQELKEVLEIQGFVCK